MTDVFSTLPPELLFDIFAREVELRPTAVTLNRQLAPFARMSAYREIRVTTRALAKLGHSLAAAPYLGELIDSLQVVDDGQVTLDEPRDTEGELLAFELMSNLRKLKVTSHDLGGFLSDARLQTYAFQHSIHTLILHSEPTTPYSALRNLHLSPCLRDLTITSPMRFLTVDRAVPSVFSPSALEVIRISSEPSSEFTAFFDSLASLSSLQLSSTDSDLRRVFSALGTRARSSLKRIDFNTFSHLSSNIDDALSVGFAPLEELTLWSSQSDISPLFFHNLSSHLPQLRRLYFRGPASDFLDHIVGFLSDVESTPAGLEILSVDVGIGSSPVVLSSEDRRVGEVKRLAEACRAIGVRLEGSILVALEVLRSSSEQRAIVIA